MSEVTTDELQGLQELAETVEELGQRVLAALANHSETTEVLTLLSQRDHVAASIVKRSDLDMMSLAQSEDVSLREAANVLQSSLLRLVQQNAILSQAMHGHMNVIQSQMNQVEHSLQFAHKYFPVSADHGRGRQLNLQG